MKPDQRLAEALNFIETSRGDLAEGKMVTLEGFQNDVKDIHNLIAAMPKEEARIYSPSIAKLLEGLKTLERELVVQQHKVQQEIFSLNRRQKALKSYETSNHSGGADGNE